jgi:cellulose synthase/poly-beta-1,6-N-acetylglucosamine synthase-like glycosyltransferase
MESSGWVVSILLGTLTLVWCLAYYRALRGIDAIPFFGEEDPPDPERWPGLSVIVAARNEAGHVREAVTSLLAQDYPGLEIILVDDRSTDETGRIIDDLAGEDSRVKAIHVQKLPAGWLGKVHALHVGTVEAGGEWLLYTDADVHFRQGILRKAVSQAVASGTDHLALMPVPRNDPFWLEVAVQAFGVLFSLGIRAWEVGQKGSDAFAGVGAFNLVRREALEKTEGFTWLKMEVIDDVGLGLLLHRSGARQSFFLEKEALWLTWYPSVRAMFKGLEKNLFAALTHYSPSRMLVVLALIWALNLAPWLTLVYPGAPFLWVFGAAALFLLGLGATLGKIRHRSGFFSLLLMPVGQLLISMMLLHSGVMCLARGGIVWRGTFHRLEELRAGQRVKL